ncbi:MAG: VanZ family protein [Pseudomonadota bacterium]
MTSLLSFLILDERWRALRYRCAWLVYAAIVLMGSVPGVRAEMGNVASGIVLHTLAYGGITFLLFTGSSGSGRARALRSVGTVVLMGAFDELVQSFLPYRRGAVSDWLIDCNAAVMMAALLWAFLPERHSN